MDFDTSKAHAPFGASVKRIHYNARTLKVQFLSKMQVSNSLCSLFLAFRKLIIKDCERQKIGQNRQKYDIFNLNVEG